MREGELKAQIHFLHPFLRHKIVLMRLDWIKWKKMDDAEFYQSIMIFQKRNHFDWFFYKQTEIFVLNY